MIALQPRTARPGHKSITHPALPIALRQPERVPRPARGTADEPDVRGPPVRIPHHGGVRLPELALTSLTGQQDGDTPHHLITHEHVQTVTRLQHLPDPPRSLVQALGNPATPRQPGLEHPLDIQVITGPHVVI